MAENVTLARPYAEAAFQLAKGGQCAGAWSDALGRLAASPPIRKWKSASAIRKLQPHNWPGFSSMSLRPEAGLSAEQQNFVRVLATTTVCIVLPEIRDAVR
jgi:F-type H+-transporting ATPase subunit delta